MKGFTAHAAALWLAVACGTSVAAAAAASAASGAPAAGCSAGTEFTPPLCPLALPPIRHVAVERQAQASAGEPAGLVDCNRFQLQPNQVRRYFARARRVAEPMAEHGVDRGPCYAEGSLRLGDGRQGRWRIEQIGSATLWIGDDAPLTLLCARCTFRPFR